ncbi:ABC transporter ATP-binding protein [Rhodococcus sp. ABRD24]|uniref:ABC transporter ATP-binding protein n=1 Tax=Rhodococcus sp. ABRD24 TaxID=2507582 RepID=UPI0013F14331|nr:ABC transporter ATP-binding protein [Rhodococcus sp. ABRD24]
MNEPTSKADSSAARRNIPVSAEDVVLRRGGITILDGASITVSPGEVVGLLGPNGAGKTSLVECLEGFQRPDSGRVEVFGHTPWTAPRGWRARIGAVLQDCRVDSELTVGEFTTMTAGYYSDPLSPGEVLARTGLSELTKRRVTRLSGGERRRLEVALALVGRPDLLFLDEPTTGLDTQSRRDLLDMLRSLSSRGTAMIITTHMLEEVATLADRIVILVAGRVLLEGTAQELSKRSGIPSRVEFSAPELEGRPIPPILAEANQDADSGLWRIMTRTPSEVIATITRLAAEEGFTPVNLAVHTPTLEDIYLELLEAPADQSSGLAS